MHTLCTADETTAWQKNWKDWTTMKALKKIILSSFQVKKTVKHRAVDSCLGGDPILFTNQGWRFTDPTTIIIRIYIVCNKFDLNKK